MSTLISNTTDSRIFSHQNDGLIDLWSGEGVFQENILSSLFALRPPALGSLEVTAVQSLLWMRTYSEEPGGGGGLVTSGLAVPPFGAEDLVVLGTRSLL